jgi:hypothetical protein
VDIDYPVMDVISILIEVVFKVNFYGIPWLEVFLDELWHILPVLSP